ncbi:zinc finger CCCH domain-containing protein 45 isoform X2 [Elaeis guineensis]|uniref:Zinc finger CCCH domain-containing protein 45 isoform X2 n=1 Tax=Elaeis guineensis var. tenera TaxID=51953 RepID=A0A6I9SCM0_ELAGV|nr:zinc finger CCCH domain-containing protein 45 isoform X2 [Elaeis guineensis]
MEDPEGALSFDFEGGLDAGGPAHASSAPASLMPSDPTAAAANAGAVAPPVAGDAAPSGGNIQGRRSFRQTVCRHWLRSLCMKGDACGFLHQYDKARMPVCRFFRLYGECREQDCVYKHTNEDIKECNMYKLGFCPNGPDCRYRHAKLPGPPPPVEEVFQKIQHLSAFNYYGSSNRYFQHRNTSYNQQSERPQLSQGSAVANQNAAAKPIPVEPSNVQQPQTQIQQSQPPPQPPPENQVQNISNALLNQATRTASPLPQGQSRYFIVKSCNRENLEISVQQGVWATQRSNEAKLNEAFESSENVILIFSVNRTRHFQGCAKMTSKIGGYVGGGNWKYAHGTAHYGRNFSVKWLKLCELSFNKTHHLRNPYNDNLPVKISRDCQELEPFIGEQLASLLYLEPDSELMAMLIAAESKRDEEKAKGVSTDEAADNPDIVLFEDNEEEEDEESEEEEESGGQSAQGRGRGRGMMWQPHMPLVRGGRPMLGVRGFPPVMMGADGFGYGDGFAAPDIFGIPPRVFGPYAGPRFPGDFSGTGPMSGLVFPGRPPQPGAIFPMGGLGMMMGPGRAPFMGGSVMGGVGRSTRPMGVPPFLHPPPPPPNTRAPKRDQRRPASDWSDRLEPGSDQGSKGQELTGPSNGVDDEMGYHHGARAQTEDKFVAANSFQNDSESEDEAAPRRSRHGEGKR